MTNAYPDGVDAIIAGGGITGASSLYHLTEASDLEVLCLEARGVNFGSTARSAAAFRHQFSSRVNVEMSLYSGRVYRQFHEEFGTEKLLVENGYLFMYRDGEQFQEARETVEFQKDLGVRDVTALSPEEVRETFSHVEGPDLVGATWCPHDGFIRPERASREFINAAFEQENTRLEQDAPVTDVEVDGGGISAVQVDNEQWIETDVFINATGVWCHQIAEMAGVKLPVAPVKRYLYFTNQFEDRDVTWFPLHVFDLGPYFRPEHEGLMMGWDRKPEEPDEFDDFWPENLDYEWMYEEQDEVREGYGLGVEGYGYEILAEAARAVPFLNKAGLTNVSSGYYQITPDSKAIISWDPRVEGLLHATGFSGHGVMHAPASGKAVADLVLERDPAFDMEALDLSYLLDREYRPDPEVMVI